MMPVMVKRKKAPDTSWVKRIKGLREAMKVTQAELAKRLRISQSQLSAFESGKRTPTRPIAYLIELLENEKI